MQSGDFVSLIEYCNSLKWKNTHFFYVFPIEKKKKLSVFFQDMWVLGILHSKKQRNSVAEYMGNENVFLCKEITGTLCLLNRETDKTYIKVKSRFVFSLKNIYGVLDRQFY